MKACTSFLLAALVLLLAGCDYEAPLTTTPTRKIEPRLAGDWVNRDDGKDESMHVRVWDDSTYAVSVDGDVYRVHHSDFGGQPFVSAQDLNSGKRAWCLYTWALSADGRQLTLRRVSTTAVSGPIQSTADLQRLVKAKLTQPDLLDSVGVFTRKD